MYYLHVLSLFFRCPNECFITIIDCKWLNTTHIVIFVRLIKPMIKIFDRNTENIITNYFTDEIQYNENDK